MNRPQRIEASPMVELAITSQGNWKKLKDGTVVPLSDKQWKEELAKSMRKSVDKPSTAELAPTHAPTQKTPDKPFETAPQGESRNRPKRI